MAYSVYNQYNQKRRSQTNQTNQTNHNLTTATTQILPLQVKKMRHEGLLTSENAEEFLEKISNDAARIERERNKLYTTMEKSHSERRSELKRQERKSEQVGCWVQSLLIRLL